MNLLHADMLEIIKIIHDQIGLQSHNLESEAESKEYGTAFFRLNDYALRFRAAKITPIKIGQFVTLWKRIESGVIMPFDQADEIDFFIVSVHKDDHKGFFLFPKTVLLLQGILSVDGKGGKRAIRVYPPWDSTDSKQARATQLWQLDYFIDIPLHGLCDKVALLKLLI